MSPPAPRTDPAPPAPRAPRALAAAPALVGLTAPRPDFEAILGAGSKSFSFASRFLRAADRSDAAVVYAFCRLADDAADDAPDPASGLSAVEGLRDELFGRRGAGPVLGAFLEVAERRGVDLRHADELLSGVASDLGTVRLEDDAALVRYGYRVAGTVGLLMCPITGVRALEAHPFAVDLGVAMQMTNICRDVAEDARRGRIYLPRTRIARAGIPPEALLSGEVAADPRLRRALAGVVAEVIRLADLYYASGDLGMRYIPVRPRVAIMVASRVYRAIGHKLLACGGDPFAGRTVVSWAGKCGSAVGALGLMLLAPRRMGRWDRPVHYAELHAPLAGLPGANPRADEAADALQLDLEGASA